MASGKTSSDAYRPLNIWQRWKLHHAVKALRSPFHSVRVAAHREIAKILRRGSKGTRRMGQRMGRHITAARQAPRDWLGKAARALWGPKHGWDHTVTGRGKGAPVPIKHAVLTERALKAGRVQVHASPARTSATTPRERTEVRSKSNNIAPGRHEGGYTYDTPIGPITAARPLDPEGVERAVKDLREMQNLKDQGNLPDDAVYRTEERTETRNGVTGPAERTSAEVITPEQRAAEREVKEREARLKRAKDDLAEKESFDRLKAESDQEHREWQERVKTRRQAGESHPELREDIASREDRLRQAQARAGKTSGPQPARENGHAEQSRGRHARPGDGDRAVNVGVVNTGPETVKVRGQATGQRSADLGDAARGFAAAVSDTARSASRDSGARNIGVISTGSGHVNARNFAVGDGATATRIGHTTSKSSAGRERFKQADAPVRSTSNPGHEHGPAAPAGTPHGRDKAPPLPSETVREAPDRGSRGRSR